MIELVESFDIYADAGGGVTQIDNHNSLLRRCNSLSSGAGLVTTSSGARNGSCLSMQNTANWAITLPRRIRRIFGFAFSINDITKAGAPFASCSTFNPGGTIPFDLFSATLTASGTIQLKANATSIATSVFALANNTYYYIEFDVSTTIVSSNIVITAQCYVNNTLVVGGAASTGINPAITITGDETFNTLKISSPGVGSGTFTLIDDLYSLDTMGANWVSRLGPVTKISRVVPASDQLANWTPSAAGTHFNLVNENPEDADATYVSSTTHNQQDIYNYQTIPGFSGTIPAVQISTCRRKTAQGLIRLANVTGATGSLDQSPNLYPGGNYVYDRYILQLDPATMMPWTAAGFNTTPFGDKLI